MIAAIVVAGGTGERFGSALGKQLAMVLGEPVLAHTLRAVDATLEIDAIVLVADPARLAEYAEAAEVAGKLVAVVPGDATRQGSVAAGLAALPEDTEVVAVHDGARPLVTTLVIAEAIATLLDHPEADGVVVGHPLFDTVKEVGADQVVSTTVDRSPLWVAQTPQVFRVAALLEACRAAAADGFLGTDDASLVERRGGRVLMVEGPRDNIKVTVPEDLVLVEAVLAARKAGG